MKILRSKIVQSTFLLCFFVLTEGCKKMDFLERTPSDFITEEETFGEIGRAEAFMANAYVSIPDLLRGDNGGNFYLGSATDESTHQWVNTGSAQDFNTGNWNPASFPMMYLWSEFYVAIRRVNVFLKNYDKIPDKGDIERKKRLLGEAYGLRAYYYFELYKMWGGVPIIEKPLDPGGDQTALPRNTIDEVIAFILADIGKAIELLPHTFEASEYGRFTATAGHALRSRVLLYYASPLSNPTGDMGRWSNAADYSRQALDYAVANSYVLSTTPANGKKAYERIFLELNNPEVIWTRNNSDGNYWDFWAGSLGSNGWYGESPLQEMVDAYEMDNGLHIADPSSGYDEQHPYENRDPRFYQTILYHGAPWQGRTVDVSPGGPDYDPGRPRGNYFLKKHILEEHDLYTGTGEGYRRYVVFRLAELYLNYAEARNEAIGPDQTVYDAINTVRARVNMPALPAGLSQAEMRDRIRGERRIELAFEDHRFWDVRRWKIAEITDNRAVHRVAVSSDGTFSYPVYESRVFDKSKHYLFPIPQSEIDKNPKLEQNAGW